MRLARALSSSITGALDALLAIAGGADSARARRLASMYDSKSPSAERRTGGWALTDGSAGGGARLGAGRLSASTGGAGRGRAAATGGRASGPGNGRMLGA